VPPQQVPPAGQAAPATMQVPAEQQPPVGQLALDAQVPTQAPPTQVCPLAQAWAQAPQLFGSEAVIVQVPLQLVVPTPQVTGQVPDVMHLPLRQSWLLGQHAPAQRPLSLPFGPQVRHSWSRQRSC
jgi:hypothetical protein